MRVFAAILAGGEGSRFQGDKALANLGSKPLWKWSYDAFAAHPKVSGLVIAASASNLDQIKADSAGALVTPGGQSRQQSALKATSATPADADLVLIHDAARPFVNHELIDRVISAANEVGAAAPGVPVADTLRAVDHDGYRLLDREGAIAMQTPQAGRRSDLLQAHAAAKGTYTDDVALLEASGFRWMLVDGDPLNFKITTPADLRRAEAMLGPVEIRTGFGYDVHRFSADSNRPLVLGGVTFPGERGLEGHSDADVVSHAVVDALLGAAALGDIGRHFPNDDPQWAGANSALFLEHASALLSKGGWRIAHVDVSVIAESPKLATHVDRMRAALASHLRVTVDLISIKATTNEGLGALGRGEGIAAMATATIRKNLA